MKKETKRCSAEAVMEFKKYLLFGAVSLAIHGVAFSSNVKPIMVTPLSGAAKTTVSLHLISAKPVAKTPSHAAQHPVSSQKVAKKTPTSQVVKPKPLAKTKPLPKQTTVKKPAKKAVQKPAVKKAVTKPTPAKKAVQQNKATKMASKATSKPLEPLVKSEPKAMQTAQNRTNKLNTPSPASKPKMLEKPRFSAKPTPIEYPRNAKRRNIEGLVLVEIWINEKGQQTKQLVIDSSGHPMLDKAALKAITQWQFKSYRDKGQLIAHRVQVPITFELN